MIKGVASVRQFQMRTADRTCGGLDGGGNGRRLDDVSTNVLVDRSIFYPSAEYGVASCSNIIGRSFCSFIAFMYSFDAIDLACTPLSCDRDLRQQTR